MTITFLGGGLIFGVALYRARVLARWASTLLAVASLLTVTSDVLPDAFYRFLAFPNAIAIIGLGCSLWLTTRTGAHYQALLGSMRLRATALRQQIDKWSQSASQSLGRCSTVSL